MPRLKLYCARSSLALIHFVRRSLNRFLGVIPASYSARESCPPYCALLGVCYGEGFPIRLHWDKVPERGITFAEFLREVKRLPKRQLWRHNVVGDLDTNTLPELVRANNRRPVICYTHRDPIREPDLLPLFKWATAEGFTINLSANNLMHADTLAATGLPVAVLITKDAPKVQRTPKGRRVVACPEVPCDRCELCTRPQRDFIIGFRPKGHRRPLVEMLARQHTVIN